MLINNNKHRQTGFALLISLIVIGAVISIGLSILDLTIKQLSLSTKSKDSEMALHAANAGLECAQYWRNNKYEELEAGDPVNFACFNLTSGNVSPSSVTLDSTVNDGVAFKYNFSFTWGATGAERCSEVSMLIINADNTDGSGNVGSGVKINSMNTVIPGYPALIPNPTKFCEPGGKCAVIAVRGYNKSCTNVGVQGTLQREVLLES